MPATPHNRLPTILDLYREKKMSQPAKQSYLGLLNILVKFSIANSALVWLVLGS